MAEIVIANPDGTPIAEFDLKGRRKVTIGRSPKCDLVIDDPRVHRHQALLYEELNQWWMIDLCRTAQLEADDEPRRLIDAREDRPIRMGKLYVWFYNLPKPIDQSPAVRLAETTAVLTRGELLEQAWIASCKEDRPNNGQPSESRVAELPQT